MKKDQRCEAIYNKYFSLDSQFTFVEVPVGHIVAWISKYFNIFKKEWYKIYPFLIRKQASFKVNICFIIQPFCPPVNHFPTYFSFFNSNKPQIIKTGI